MSTISNVLRYIQDAFGEPEAPEVGPNLEAIPLSRRRHDTLEAYRDYLATGGEPISVWDDRLADKDEHYQTSIIKRGHRKTAHTGTTGDET